MSQHSWYDKNRRHYGPKPNTRRARGLPIRIGKTGPLVKKSPSNLPIVEVDKNVKPIAIPERMKTIKRYAKMYNWYVQQYDKYPDKNVCIALTVEKFGVCDRTVMKAIRVCKYILATTPQE